MRNRYFEAFKESHNIVGIAAAISASAALLSPLPLLVGLVAEAGYLLFVADSRWYALRLAKRYDTEVELRRDQLKTQVLPTLRPEMVDRFQRLEGIRQQISVQGSDGQPWVREVLRKLDYLLEKFLQFACKDLQFRLYLHSVLEAERAAHQRSAPAPHVALDSRFDVDFSQRRTRVGSARQQVTPPAQAARPPTLPAGADDAWAERAITAIREGYQGDIDRVGTLLQQEGDASTRAVLEKRVDVLHRRQEFITKIGRILANLSHQLELLEDTFGLISDEIQARSPEQVLSDIEDVVSQTNTMTQLLDEMAPFEQTLAHIAS